MLILSQSNLWQSVLDITFVSLKKMITYFINFTSYSIIKISSFNNNELILMSKTMNANMVIFY